jgi:hypothetical protein
MSSVWAKRQLEKAGIEYVALDNGFFSCSDPEKLQKICDRLGTWSREQFLVAMAASIAIAIDPSGYERRICV